jgi:hypothetical protein
MSPSGAGPPSINPRTTNENTCHKPPYKEYHLPHPTPSTPYTIDEFICAPFLTSIIIAYTVSSDIGIQNAYAELFAASSGLLLDLNEAIDLPSGVLDFKS